MDTSHTKMTCEFSGRTTGAPRPTTLPLGLTIKNVDPSEGSYSAVKRAAAGRKKRCRASEARVKKFGDIYETTGESLGEGSFGHVTTYRNIVTRKEFAVKIIMKTETKSRLRVLKEIEIFHHCQGHKNILQLVEYFEEDDKFYLVFEKMEGGTLLDCILNRGHLTEQEASRVVRDIASGLNFLHKKGIAHRDLKPENILCVRAGQLTPVKICDFDLGSGIQITGRCTPVTTPELLSPVGSADFMAPEVVDVWQYRALSYDKRCDLWSLGIILYILLCGYRPFYAHCGRDCGFDEGGDCEDCQERLFRCIQQGVYSFPKTDWSEISDDAKDLIQHLLVKNPYQRYTAEQVLRHPWLNKDLSASTPLATPFILSRNNSVRELGMFAETANAVNRLIQQHISMSEISSAARTPTYVTYDEQRPSADLENDSSSPEKDRTPVGDLEDGQRLGYKQEMDMCAEADGGLGSLSDEDDVDMRRSLQSCESLFTGDSYGSESLFIGDSFDDDVITEYTRAALSSLTVAGSSAQKVRREAFKVKKLSECSVDSGNVSSSSSPPDY